MNLGLAAPKAAVGPNAGKRPRAAEPKAAANHDKLLHLVAKLSLNNAQRQRILSSILLDNLLLNAEHPLATAPTQAGQQFAKAMQEATNKEQRDSIPAAQVFVWNALVDASLASGNPQLIQAAKDYTKALSGEADTASKIKTIMSQVKYARVNKTWKSDIKRIEVRVIEGTPSAAMWEAIKVAAVKDAKGEVKQGVPPRLNLEREIQEILERAE